ncbi:MAG: carboxypeptidase-like regulatory domain-containing protein [Nannocystales bacterium]
MSRRAWLGLLATAALLGVALWTLRPTIRGGSTGFSLADDDAGEGSLGSRGGGGVRAAEVDLDASHVVRGEVVDADGRPLTEGALLLRCLQGDAVRVLGTVKVDEEGQFEGPGCRGQVCATLQHASQSPAEPWVLRPGSRSVLRTEGLERLWGEVVTPTGDSVEAARIVFLPAGPADERDPLALLPLVTRSTTSDADGRFSVAWIQRAPCGPCEEATGGCAELPDFVEGLEVLATAPGFAAGRAAFDRDSVSDPDAPLRVVLTKAEDLLTGQLLDSQGNAYARAYVLAQSVDRPREQRRAEVDAEGNFEMDGLGPGSHRVRALQDGVELATGEADAGADVELAGTVEARGPDLEVSVLLENGRFAVGATVDGGPFHGEKTDMKGKVRAESVLPGTMALRVRQGGRSQRTRVEIPGADEAGTAHPHRVEIRLGEEPAHPGPRPGL